MNESGKARQLPTRAVMRGSTTHVRRMRRSGPALATVAFAASLASLFAPGGVQAARRIAPVTRVARTARVATAPSAAPAKKGVDAWSFPGVGAALERSGASWYLTWSTEHAGITSLPSVQFVPMIWGAGSVTASSLAAAKRSGPDLLTFNEPDLRAQADMTVSQALALWPRLMATGMRLASPAVASGGATPGGWLDRFMRRAVARRDRVDFVALHWYGGDFRTGSAVAQLKSYLVAVHDRYELPLWLTEYALIDFTASGPMFPSGAQQAAFVRASARMLDGLSFVQRYAWFALATSRTGPSMGLFTPGARPTAAGRAFERS